MIFHASIAADDPKHVSEVIAELWGGIALEFVPLNNGSWIALGPDDRNSAVEVYPRGQVYSLDGERGMNFEPGTTGLTATHLALATSMTPEEVEALGKREGWTTRKLFRKLGLKAGDHIALLMENRLAFMELCFENKVMFEILTEYMQKQYLESSTIPRWTAAIEGALAARAAAASGSQSA